jgi:hypothetical protein
MRFTFGFYNGCYWLIISTAEQLQFALENTRMTQKSIDVYIDTLNNLQVIYLNEAGGYHMGKIQNMHTDKTQIIVKDNIGFPTKWDRVEVMKKELIEQINEIHKELDLPLINDIIL